VTPPPTRSTLGSRSTVGEELLEARRDGDPRISLAGRETLRRFVTGDLMGVLQAGLEADAEADPALSGSDPLDD